MPTDPIVNDVDSYGVSAENPWPGLLSFRETDQRWFQGRQEETRQLLGLVKRERMSVLFALSGIGKSSLLQAGLFPALRRDLLFPVPVRLDYAPGPSDLRQQVFEAILQAAVGSEIRVHVPRPGQTLWEYFHHIQTEFWDKNHRRVLPVLVFDQFEEIFTLGRAEHCLDSAEAFLEELADLAEGTPPPSVRQRWESDPADRDHWVETGEYKLLVSLREDFLAEFYDQRRRIATVPQSRLRLRQMNGAAALVAVAQAKHLVDETIGAQIVRFVAAGDRFASGRASDLSNLDVEPALLSVVCRELNNRRRQRNELMISADLLQGNQEEILSEFYNRSFDGLNLDARSFVEEQLITVTGARNSVPLENALAAKGMTAAIIEQLVERRLLRKEFRRDEVRVELTHDLLTGIVRVSRDRRRLVEERAEEERIRAIEREEQERKRQEAESRAKAFRRFAFGLAGVALVAVFAAVFAWRQTQVAQAATAASEMARRQESEARQNEANARVQAENERKLAVKSEQIAQFEREAANIQRAAADKSANEARENQRRATLAAAEAKKQEDLAKVAQKQSDENALTAKKNETKAIQGQATIKEQLEDIARREAESRKTAAVGAVSTVVEAVSANQTQRALGEVARALRLDGELMSARSWAFDLLTRGAARSGPQGIVQLKPTVDAGVVFAVYSLDGRRVATASRDQMIRIWDVEKAGEILSIPTRTPVVSVSFSPDGQRVVAGLGDRTARVFNVSDGQQLAEFGHGNLVYGATFSPDGSHVVTASLDKTARIWSVAGKREEQSFAHPRAVNFAVFDPSGRSVATACADGKVRIFSVSGGPGREVASHTKEVTAVNYSRDGSRIVTASADSSAKVWNLQTGTATDAMAMQGPVRFATFSRDGRRVATASEDKTVVIWDAASGKRVSAPLVHRQRVMSVAFSPDGRRILTAPFDNEAQIWDVWFDFDNINTVVQLAEAVGGYDASGAELRSLPLAEREQRLRELRSRTEALGRDAAFVRSFFANHK